MSQAAERTLLAYVRTALALLAAGVAMAGALPDAGAQGLRRGVGALRARAPLPRPVAATALTTAPAVVAVVALVVVALV